MAWSWRLEAGDGSSVALASEPPHFPSQSDAESWLGEVWRELAEIGATQASLYDGDHLVYGPMSLAPE